MTDQEQEREVDDGSDFAACVRFLQATIAAPKADSIVAVSRDDAKAVCREIMRLQEAYAQMSDALGSTTAAAGYIGGGDDD